MNTSIETLNLWGQTFLNFAWPMLWQSSLLIIVVAILDFLFAQKIRAAIRHALWMVVLVKLLLPPALALPTGAAWWLWPAKPAPTPIYKSETVTFDTTPLPTENFVPQTAPITLPPPKLNGLGWTMLASGIVSAGLLFSLLLNWLKVARKTHRTRMHATTSGNFADPLEQARKLAGLRRPMRLKLVDDAISPAVYGLFRPVILLPRALAEKLSAAQLRAVLLHEAVHLRRGDVWVNCAQTLLQIAYWWHPLLWLANARIRRLREEAVDDAVMLALRGDADAYAPTLLEVAKFAFRRPLASLGLVGILESRSALRQRVERLVDFRPPRRAGVTFLSLLGIFLFGAVTLPMGQAPAAETNAAFPNAAMIPPQSSLLTPVNTPGAITPAGVTNKLETQQFNPATPPLPRGTISIVGQPLWTASAPLPQTIHVATTNTGPRFDVEHYRISGNSLLTRQTISATLANIDGAFGTNVSYEGVKTVQEQLQQAYYERGYATVKVTLPMQKITNATVKIQVLEGRISAGSSHNDILINAPALHTSQTRPESAHTTQLYWRNPGPIPMVPFGAILDPLGIRPTYRPAYASVNPADLESRFFPVGVTAFYAAVLKKTGETNALLGFEELAAAAGVDFYPPKTIFLDGMGFLVVDVTKRDVGILRGIVDDLHCPPQQIHIKARFIEVPQKTLAILQEQYLQQGMTNGIARLTNPQAQSFLHSIQWRDGVKELSEPEATTIAGEQTQMRTTVIQPIVTRFLLDSPTARRESTDPKIGRVETAGGYFYAQNNSGRLQVGQNSFNPQVGQLETGPVLDVDALTPPDGFTISLHVTASDTQFLGYASPTGLTSQTVTNRNGEKVELPAVLPAAQLNQASTQQALYDGQTLVLFPQPKQEVFNGQDENAQKRVADFIQQARNKDGDKAIIALVTATMINPAGYRIHTDADIPSGLPPPWP